MKQIIFIIIMLLCIATVNATYYGNFNVTDNVTAQYFIGDGSLLTGLAGTGTVTQVNVLGPYMIPATITSTGNVDLNETKLNETIDARAISGSGTVTEVGSGNGMDFTNITTNGLINLGTPTTLTGSTSNTVTTTSHAHAVTTDASGECGAGNICGGGHLHDDRYYTEGESVINFVNRSDWTTHDDYPTGCSANEYVTSIGDTLVCIQNNNGTVLSVAAGNGMDFTTITGTGSITMGTPSTLTGTTSNAVTTTSHTHAVTTDSTGTCASGVICAGDHTHPASQVTSGTFDSGSYVFTGGTLDADTLNTGQGDNELYGMDQNVLTTSTPAFGDVFVDEYLIHTGDTNTYLGFLVDDFFQLFVGGSERMRTGGSGIIFNENGEDVDFRIESDTFANAFAINGATGVVSIGNNLSISNDITSVDNIRLSSDTTNHVINDNSTCVIITGDTSTLSIC